MDKEAIQSISARDFLHVIFKRKTVIALFLTVTVCAVAIVSFRQQRTYTATAQILIKIGRESIYLPEVPTGDAPRAIITPNQINTEIEILKSRSLAENVVETLGPGVIYGDPAPSIDEAAAGLQESLMVEAIEDSNVVRVSFGHEDPRMAATVVNTVVDMYLERRLQVHRSPHSQDFFGDQAETLDVSAKVAEQRLEAFKNRHDLSSLEDEQKLLLTHEAGLRAELNRTLSQQAEIEKRIQQLRSPLATAPEAIPVNLNDETMRNIRTKLVELELQEHALLGTYSDQSRLVERVRGEIAMVRRRLVEHASDLINQEIVRNETELQSLKAREKTQRAQLDDYRKKSEKLNGIEMQFNRLKQEVEVHRQNYRLYLTKFEESRISDAMDKEKIANVSVIEPAKPPLQPESRNIARNMVLAMVLGGMGGLGLALFSEYLEDGLERDADVEYHLDLPVLASIPQIER